MHHSQIPQKKRLRQFGCILGGIFIALGTLSFYRHAQTPLSHHCWIYFGLALLDLIVTFVWTQALAPVEKIFAHVGSVLGFITTRIVLGFVFFFILTPIGIFFKISGRHSPFQKIDKKLPSYWEDSQNSPPERFQRQF